MTDVSSTTSVFLSGGINIADNKESYLRGGIEEVDNRSAYLDAILRSGSSTFLAGVMPDSSSAIVYLNGLMEEVRSTAFTYLSGISRDNKNVYLKGVYMAQVDYIWLKTSDLSVAKKFRVLAQDYDDGTLEKAEEINKTIGGGIDHSVGAVYKSWSAIIRVRHTETETDFGNKDDLEYFYSLNNPNGTPSNDITLIDHHQVEYTVHIVGKLTKNLMGCEVEGTEAWYLYKLQLLRIQ